MKTFCILQVEDTEEDVVLMEYAFREAGLENELRGVPHGQAAIDYLSGKAQFSDRRRFPLPGLILLDLKLPGIGGLDVLRWIRASSNHRTTPVIVLTSSGQESDIEESYQEGANAFITKPSGIVELIELLRAMKVFWLQYAQFPQAVVGLERQGKLVS
jgi:CheY-like chemotaxis protein